MKCLFTLLLACAGYALNAQTTEPPGTMISRLDTVSWQGTKQHTGSKFRLTTGGTVHVSHLETRLVGQDTCIYAVSSSARYYAMNPAAERHSGKDFAYEHFNLTRPANELGANLYDAGRSLRMYQGLKLASFGTGIACGLTVLLAAQQSSQPQSNTANGSALLVAGTFAGASLILNLLADAQVNKAGRLLQIASGRISLGR